ncbi:hypothetical protein HYPSUDRAFT_45077 [Hypholoma sublateritium FD-334 SS-4]|uniref:Uncharacterized protein n=1 Tax=Hypholoma sublateritium (strain FD-334 SS-4) TaxID=945553 RepID=A0A0D2NP38_HYPSF|nr:hypothetical protein HYPSUDRAFT_45077 [Hypholoma sublateritium FD-334 SS-4]
MSSAGMTAQDPGWKSKQQAEEALYAHKKEQEQLEAIRQSIDKATSAQESTHPMDKDFEGGFGGQEDLEDRYATTSGEH